MKFIKKVNFFAVIIACIFLAVLPVSAKSGNTTSNIYKNVCRNGKYIYYAVNNGIYQYDMSNKTYKQIRKFSAYSISNLNVYNNKMYFVLNTYMGMSGLNDSIYCMNLNGSGLKKLVKGTGCMAMDGYIYYIKTKHNSNWNCDESLAVCKMKLDGTNKTELRKVRGLIEGYLQCLIAYKGRLYYTEENNSYWSVKTDGSDLRYELSEKYTLINFDGNYMYYSDSIGIYRKQIGKQESIGNKIGENVGLHDTIQNNILYYTKSIVNSGRMQYVLYKKVLSTGKTEKILSSSYMISGVALCGDKIFLKKFLGMQSPKLQNFIYTINGKKERTLQKYNIDI